MIMITGGAFAGKKKFAREHFGIGENEVLDGGSCEPETVFSAKCVSDYHLLVKRLINEKIDVEKFTKRLCKENPGAVIIINETGCGIIPLEKSDRIWRKETGRAGCINAENFSAVVRVCCGIPTAIKGEIIQIRNSNED
ncbi:MAG: bifunctional adenosylcobinamide kinase/adenosylcobinamide-phosphate guanylyltransferase [Ruminococcus sp.]|nr:bifunctional adenosylcobinamide kinase/adenosylcobinamide-phosphate guanylyltransferase [Ruminococcus sp.]